MRGSIVSPNSSPRKMDKLRVLIVEDNGLFRQALRNGLQLSFPGVAIDEATNGAEALQLLLNQNIRTVPKFNLRVYPCSMPHDSNTLL